MKHLVTCALMIVGSGMLPAAQSPEHTILTMERRAMDGWLQGNPDAFLDISDPTITYFHYTLETRLDGLPAVRALYESYRGRPLFDRYEIVDPNVVVAGNVAVLTYQLTTQNGSLSRRWNATEVFRDGQTGWRIIHTHFSLVKQ
jgi:ketosteroid isomerase-like protein